MFHFAMLPPEINSARMYAGPGSGPLLAAASAWDGLALQLELSAIGYSEALTSLHGHSWSGPSATAMATAAAPYVEWVTRTALQAEQAAAQARMAAAAYEAAFAATVPPAVVAANRTLLAALVATNFFGQNLPAIAATEAAYGEMWAQDAAAMFGYAEASAPSADLSPFAEPPATTTEAGLAAQEAAVGRAAATPVEGEAASTLPQQLQTLSAPATADPAPTQPPPPSVLELHQYFNAYTKFTQTPIQIQLTSGAWGSLLFKLGEGVLPHKAAAIMPAAGLGAASAGVHPTAVHARVGTAIPMGALSVPPGWAAATPSAGTAAVQLTSASTPAITATPGSTPHLMAPPLAGAGAQQRTGGTPVLRTLNRRFRMPRPAFAG